MVLEGDELRYQEEMLMLLNLIAKALFEQLLQMLVNKYRAEGAASAINAALGLPDAVTVAFLRLLSFVHYSATIAAVTDMLTNPQGQLVIKLLGQYVVIATFPNSVIVSAERLRMALQLIHTALLRQEYQIFLAIASILEFIDDVPTLTRKLRMMSTLITMTALTMTVSWQIYCFPLTFFCLPNHHLNFQCLINS